MASTPTYASTPRYGAAQLNNAGTTTNSAAALTGAAAGTRVNEIRIAGGPTTAPGGTYKIAVLLDDSVNVRVIDVVTLTNAVDTLQAVLQYANLILPSASYSIKFASRTTLTSGATLDCSVYGADLT
jgi:hypothetical protein